MREPTCAHSRPCVAFSEHHDRTGIDVHDASRSTMRYRVCRPQRRTLNDTLHSGVSTVSTEQADLLGALGAPKPTNDAQLSLL